MKTMVNEALPWEPNRAIAYVYDLAHPTQGLTDRDTLLSQKSGAIFRVQQYGAKGHEQARCKVKCNDWLHSPSCDVYNEHAPESKQTQNIYQ